MIRTLDRYLLKSFLTNYLLSLGVLVSLYVVLDLFVNFDEFTKGGRPVLTVLAYVVDYYFHNLPLYFSQLSGVITLFAACGTMARLQRQNEITAVLASGTSLYRLAAPIILAGLGMNALLVADMELLLPKVAPKLVRHRDDVDGTRIYDLWFVRDGDQRLVSAMQFSPTQGRIRGLIIMELLDDPDPRQRGRMGDLIEADQAVWDAEEGGWRLLRGVRTRVTSGTGDGLSGEYRLERIPERFYETALSPDELRLRQTTYWMHFLSIRQLGQLEARGDVQADQIAQIRHTRFTLPINNMILLLLGLTFFMTREPTSVLTAGAKAVGVCSVSFLVAYVGQQLVGAADVLPAAPAWVPIFLFGPLVVLLLDNVKT